jgi:nucleoid DNA-binding protein
MEEYRMQKRIAISKITDDPDLFRRIYNFCLGGYVVLIRGFGTFRLKRRASRMGRNPRTGAKYRIPERGILVFKASPGIRLEYDK